MRLAVGVVTKPFLFEGKRRMSNADLGIDALKREVDTLNYNSKPAFAVHSGPEYFFARHLQDG